VLGYTMMVRDQSVGEQREYLQRILDNSQRIKDIVDDMVSLRHLEMQEVQLALEPVVLQELVAQVIERLRPSLNQRPHALHFDLPEQPLGFLCDREKLLLILTHLLSNAIKFTPEGGWINIRASVQPPDALENNSSRILQPVRPASSSLPWVILEIEDSGIGIPEREQPRIFDRFYQVADSLTRDQGGTGLGLALVRELVGAMGGAVWLTSIEGSGSTFTCALPYRQEQAASDERRGSV
jgi:signal transduction histidine kinase